MSEPDGSVTLRPGDEPQVDPATVELVRRFRADGDADDLRWCAAPTLVPTIARARSRRGSLTGQGLRTLSAVLPLRRGLNVRSVGSILLASHGGNPLRVLAAVEPLLEGHGGPARHASPPAVPIRAAIRWARAARRLTQLLEAQVRAARLELHAATAAQIVGASARAMARAEVVLAREAPSALVVATQHAADVRALLLLATRQGVPTVYLPHAPVETSPKYADLPTSFAGLRGEGERALYEALGAGGELHIVGNPSVDVPRDVRPPAHGVPVLALPPGPASLVDELVRLVDSAVDERVDVAPHPRGDLDDLRSNLPAGWRLIPEGTTTFDRLREGASYVLQHSSGVAWESLALGLPTIDLAHEGVVSPYPVIAPPAVDAVHSTEGLRLAIARARATGADEAARDELVRWARHWCDRTGASAAEDAAALVRTAASSRRADPLLDAWGRPGRGAQYAGPTEDERHAD